MLKYTGELEKLKEFGFKKEKYFDEYTYYVTLFDDAGDEVFDVGIVINTTTRELDYEFCIGYGDDSPKNIVFDKLYDLIKSGFIEKVEE